MLQDQEDLLPKLMKPKENWNETSEAVNKVWTTEWWDVIEKSTKLFHCKTFWKEQKIINSFYKVETSVWKGTEKKWGKRSNLYLSDGWNIFIKWKQQCLLNPSFEINSSNERCEYPGLCLHRGLCKTCLKQQIKSG